MKNKNATAHAKQSHKTGDLLYIARDELHLNLAKTAERADSRNNELYQQQQLGSAFVVLFMRSLGHRHKTLFYTTVTSHLLKNKAVSRDSDSADSTGVAACNWLEVNLLNYKEREGRGASQRKTSSVATSMLNL